VFYLEGDIEDKAKAAQLSLKNTCQFSKQNQRQPYITE
jgi:hypothetical protein